MATTLHLTVDVQPDGSLKLNSNLVLPKDRMSDVREVSAICAITEMSEEYVSLKNGVTRKKNFQNRRH
ncbi:hypothetical protein G0S15_005027 [Salmonella enterica]|nr:hypothetical protein [Salmonella enterica]HBJ6841649.1 hypothetical protein [Salmonella enterica subsp. diarizonae serovar 48:i:z]